VRAVARTSRKTAGGKIDAHAVVEKQTASGFNLQPAVERSWSGGK